MIIQYLVKPIRRYLGPMVSGVINCSPPPHPSWRSICWWLKIRKGQKTKQKETFLHQGHHQEEDTCFLLPVSWLHLWLHGAILSVLPQQGEHDDAISRALDEEAANQVSSRNWPTHRQDNWEIWLRKQGWPTGLTHSLNVWAATKSTVCCSPSKNKQTIYRDVCGCVYTHRRCMV